jgi:hypothetical protein
MTKSRLRFWRVALWGVITFLLFSVLFWCFFAAFIAILSGRRPALSSVLPGPVPPSIAAGVLTLLFAALGMIALWKFQLRHEPAPLPVRFANYKGNAELWIRLLLLVLLLAIGSSVPQTSHIETRRCSLFTAELACVKYHDKLPSEGFYNFSGYNGWNSAIYASGEKATFKIGKLWVEKFAYEDVQVERTRFGWPLQAITRDVAPQESEWHIVFEPYVEVNLLVGFWGWLCIQPMISLGKWLVSLVANRFGDEQAPRSFAQ